MLAHILIPGFNRLSATAVAAVALLTLAVPAAMTGLADEQTSEETLDARLLLSSAQAIDATLLSLDRDTLTTSGGSLSRDGLIRIDFPVPSDHTNSHSMMVVELTNGDRLYTRMLGLEGESLRLQLRGDEAKSSRAVPLEYLRGIHLGRAANRRGWQTLAEWSRRMRTAEADLDQLYLANGDRLSGTVETFSEQQIVLSRSEGQPVEIPLDRVFDLVFARGLQAEIDQTDAVAVVVTDDGSILTCRDLIWSGARGWRLVTVWAAEFELASERVASVRWLGPHLRELSSEEPVRTELTGWFNPPPPPLRNRCVLGTPLAIGDRPAARGIGCHARTDLEFALEPSDAMFYAEVGLDRIAGRQGDVTFEVWLDERRVASVHCDSESTNETSVLRIPVSGHQRLQLVADFAARGDIMDLADWAETVIVRKPAP